MFRFAIRDVLWLTALVAALVAWWLDRGRLWQQAEADRTAVELYKRYQLDVVLEERLHPRPTVKVIKLPLFPTRPLNGDYQLPPADRTPWIEKIERKFIHEEKP